MPCVLVHMDAFEANIRRFASIARKHGKTVRVGSKSIRVPKLIFHIMKLHPDVFRGVLCYRYAAVVPGLWWVPANTRCACRANRSVREAAFLSSVAKLHLGEAYADVAPHLDFLVAYPTFQAADVEAAFDSTLDGEHAIYLMVSSHARRCVLCDLTTFSGVCVRTGGFRGPCAVH